MSITTVLIFLLCLAVVYLLYRNYLRELQIKELKKQQSSLEDKVNETAKRLQNLSQTVKELIRKVEAIDQRLSRVEDWSAENPILLLARADTWIEDIRQGSSRVNLQEQVLPVLRRVCEMTDTSYWLVQVGKKLKKAKRLVAARNSESKDDLLVEIESMVERFGIHLDRV